MSYAYPSLVRLLVMLLCLIVGPVMAQIYNQPFSPRCGTSPAEFFFNCENGPDTTSTYTIHGTKENSTDTTGSWANTGGVFGCTATAAANLYGSHALNVDVDDCTTDAENAECHMNFDEGSMVDLSEGVVFFCVEYDSAADIGDNIRMLNIESSGGDDFIRFIHTNEDYPSVVTTMATTPLTILEDVGETRFTTAGDIICIEYHYQASSNTREYYINGGSGGDCSTPDVTTTADSFTGHTSFDRIEIGNNSGGPVRNSGRYYVDPVAIFAGDASMCAFRKIITNECPDYSE